MQILDDEDENLDLTMIRSTSFTLTTEVTKLLKKVPPRPVTDILIQHFFSEANWIYEMVDATTFTEHYDEWWAGTCRTIDDLEFAALLLRLCCYTAQFLPSQNYTADTIIGNSLTTIREQCNATATSLTRTSIMKEGSPSMTRIHELFFHACYLKNEGEMKESWDVLSDAIHKAHELGLHLDLREASGRLITQYNVEMRKRTYWNLWLWDKYVSSSLRPQSFPIFSHCAVALT